MNYSPLLPHENHMSMNPATTPQQYLSHHLSHVSDRSSWHSDEDLPQPVRPWMPEAAPPLRNQISRSSIDTASLHLVKRHLPNASTAKKRQRWTSHKWWLLFSNTVLFCYGLGILLLSLLTYFKLYLRADVVLVGQPIILNLVAAAGSICLFTSLVGYTGIMLNNRSLLTVYNILLWPCFAMIAAIGYSAYRKNKWNIDGKINGQWHHQFTTEDRQRIQANLHCCGFKDFFDSHESSNKCFPRTLLPGCRFKYEQFTVQALTITYIVAFSVVPAHLFVLFSAMLCSNHINRKFGKGLPPKLYRLNYQGTVGIAAGSPTTSAVHLPATTGLQHRRSQL